MKSKKQCSDLIVNLSDLIVDVVLVGYAEHLDGSVTATDQQIVFAIASHVKHVDRRHGAAGLCGVH